MIWLSLLFIYCYIVSECYFPTWIYEPVLLMEEIDNIIVGSIEIPSVFEFPFLFIIKK